MGPLKVHEQFYIQQIGTYKNSFDIFYIEYIEYLLPTYSSIQFNLYDYRYITIYLYTYNNNSIQGWVSLV